MLIVLIAATAGCAAPAGQGAPATSAVPLLEAPKLSLATPALAATRPIASVAAGQATAASTHAVTPAPVAAASATLRAPRPTATPNDGLRTIALADLPREARDTIRLIGTGGPFPFDRDGLTFQNREELLPQRPRGYYREYTVITPGSRDRGARRIVAGEGGELYYTDDHYDSFRRVIP